jgi:predicted Rossmann fold nucleotide-binding protein DprA/Smf involved in DNA uptake
MKKDSKKAHKYKSDAERMSKEITDIVMLLKKDYPTLYKTLDETPLSLVDTSGSPNNKELEDYLKTLRIQLARMENINLRN